MNTNIEKSIKIIHIITRLDIGGSSDIVLRLSDEQKKRGYDVLLISGLTKDTAFDIERFNKRTGINIIFIQYLKRDINLFNDLITLGFVMFLLLKEKPTIVHLHSSKAGFIGRIAAKLLGVKCIIYSTHGHIFYGYFHKVKTWFFIQLEHMAAYFCDAITTLSKNEKMEFCRRKITKGEKIFIVPNGLDIKMYSHNHKRKLRSELGIDESAIILGWIGRFEAVKGPDMFISVCRKLKALDPYPNTKAVMIGNGKLYQEIKRNCKTCGLADFMFFTGYRKEINILLNDIDILILTSRNEGFGMVILEAMANGKPTVAMDVGGVKEIIENGVTGYLVPYGDSDAMANCIFSLIQKKEDRILLGNNAYQKSHRYSFKEMSNKYEYIYNNILSVK